MCHYDVSVSFFLAHPVVLIQLFNACKFITLRIKLPQMGQLQTVWSIILNTAIFRMYYLSIKLITLYLRYFKMRIEMNLYIK